MDLPLVEEIREARRLAEEAQDAQVHYQRIQAVVASLSVLERQFPATSRMDLEMPGDNLVEVMSERWPQMADLAASGPRPTQPLSDRILMRRQQMEGAAQLLVPIVHDAERRAKALHDLQHEQRAQLEDPRYAEAVAELHRLGAERDQALRALDPMNRRLQAIEPAHKVVASFLERLDQIRASEMAIPGAAAWRAAMVARDLVGTVDSLFGHLNLEVPRPPQIEVPVEPDPEQADALMAETKKVRDALADLLVALEAEDEKLGAQVADLKERYEAATERIKDRMG